MMDSQYSALIDSQSFFSSTRKLGRLNKLGVHRQCLLLLMSWLPSVSTCLLTSVVDISIKTSNSMIQFCSGYLGFRHRLKQAKMQNLNNFKINQSIFILVHLEGISSTKDFASAKFSYNKQRFLYCAYCAYGMIESNKAYFHKNCGVINNHNKS